MENMSIRYNGFTLIELLVAMAISGIVAVAIFTVFKSQQDSYIVQEDVAAMQQNRDLQFAFDMPITSISGRLVSSRVL
ncbi:MAG: hypothetical protein B1H11_10855 [Desulfobacteraceae bacterium 4484_190.1]|nr:MAG: hypothetical protein B1H11_10855 [Desulfobacteraceae bacterium 4484_190.1]